MHEGSHGIHSLQNTKKTIAKCSRAYGTKTENMDKT